MAMRFRFSDCVLDAERFELSRRGAPVTVQPKVLELLLFLVRNHERAVGKQELLDAVWRDVATGESSLTRAVSLARTAIGERERGARVIQTVRGRGYRIGVPVLVEAHAAGAPARPSGDFVGRERELALGGELLALASAGRAQLLIVSGEPGIGKTRFAVELIQLAEARGGRGFAGRCHDGEGMRPYGAWLEILRALIAEQGSDALLATLGERAAEITELVPELRHELPELPSPSPADPQRTRARLFDAVVALLVRRSASSPFVVLLDDLHAADEASLALLRFVIAGVEKLRLLLVVTHRGADAGDALAHTLAELARFPARSELRLAGLDEVSARQLVEKVSGSEPGPAWVQACLARSEGNPFFLLELLRWRERSDELPEGVRHVIRRRLGTLSPGCRGVLAAAAILGREFRLALLAQIHEIAEADALATLEEAERARVIEPIRSQPGRFRFAHGLIAEALVEDLTQAARARLHQRAALALEALYRPRPLAPTDLPLAIRGEHLAELAHHFFEAQPLADAALALDYCERAGEHALSLLAFADAARWFERALGLLESSTPHDAGRRERLSRRCAEARAGSS